jgi:hypothetical protein
MWTPRAIALLIGLLMVVPLAKAQLPKAPDIKAQLPKAPDPKIPDPKVQPPKAADTTTKAPDSKAQDAQAPDSKAPKAAEAKGQDFRVEEVAVLADLPVGQLKSQTIVFADHPPEKLVDPGTGFMRYEDWAKARPLEQQFLGLYPGYTEPNTDIVVDGAKKHFKEKLHMYVAAARFVLSRPPGSLDLARLISLPFVEQIDPAIKHRLISAGEVTATQDPKVIYNQNPQRRWCEGRPTVLCVRSHYQLEGRFPLGIQLANKIRDSAKPVSPFLDFESEFTLRSPAEVEQAGLAKLTGLDTPSIGAIEQSIFYVNQVMQFGKLLAVFQQMPGDPSKTVATVFMALAIDSNGLEKRKEFALVPVLRNLVPAQVLAGKSSFNTGSSLSAGLPVYARSSVKAIAALLERE